MSGSLTLILLSASKHSIKYMLESVRSASRSGNLSFCDTQRSDEP